MKEQKISKGWSIASLCCGIAGITLCLMPYFALPLSILAIIFYTRQKESALSKAGLICGIIGTVINSVTLLFLVSFLAIFG